MFVESVRCVSVHGAVPPFTFTLAQLPQTPRLADALICADSAADCRRGTMAHIIRILWALTSLSEVGLFARAFGTDHHGVELPTACGASTLIPGAILLPRHSLVSQNGHFNLRMQPDGNVIMFDVCEHKILFALGVGRRGHGLAGLTLEPNGTALLRFGSGSGRAHGIPLLVPSKPSRVAALRVGDDAHVALVGEAGAVLQRFSGGERGAVAARAAAERAVFALASGGGGCERNATLGCSSHASTHTYAHIHALLHSSDPSRCRNTHVLKGENEKEPDVHVCLDSIPPSGCVVYSIGIANNWIFDDFMASKGCSVFSFDPSMTGTKKHQRHANHWFEAVGIGTFDGMHTGESTLYGGNSYYPVETLSRIMERHGHTHLIEKASHGGEAHGALRPPPTVIEQMLKGMLLGSRPKYIRANTTTTYHDNGPHLCVPTSVVNRPRSTFEFFEWYYACGKYANCGRSLTMANKALINWCKAIGTLSDVGMLQWKEDCDEYLEANNADFQRRFNDQQFVDLFLAGIIKLDRLNQAWHMQGEPGPRPRLHGVFADKSPVSKVILECIKLDLIELAENPKKRSEVILSQIPIMLSRGDEGGYVSETEAPPRPRSALRVPIPPGTPLTQTGGLLQLQSPQPPPTIRNFGSGYDGHDGRRHAGSRPGSGGRPGPTDTDLPAAPRMAGLLQSTELLSTQEIRERDITPVFASDQTLNGKCINFYLNAVGCDRPNCIFCKRSLLAMQSTDHSDVSAALRRAAGAANARARPGTPGRDDGRRGRSGSHDRSASAGRGDGRDRSRSRDRGN